MHVDCGTTCLISGSVCVPLGEDYIIPLQIGWSVEMQTNAEHIPEENWRAIRLPRLMSLLLSLACNK